MKKYFFAAYFAVCLSAFAYAQQDSIPQLRLAQLSDVQKTPAAAPRDTSVAQTLQNSPLPASTQEELIEVFGMEYPPQFPSGEAALMRFLAKNIKYPPKARENNIEGIAAVTFIVEKDGAISNVTIVKNPGAGCGREVVRALSVMPAWEPGMVDGEPVRVRFTLPVRFRL